MPEATFYPTDLNTDAAKALEDAYNTEHDARAKEINRAWDYYEGKHKRQLKIQEDGYDDNVVTNHVGPLADRVVGFMIGDGISFDIEGNEGDEEADQEVNALWDANRGEALKEALVLCGAVEGHPAVRLEQQPGDYPKLTRIRGVHFAAFWNPFDTSDVLWYRLQHIAGGMGKRIDYVNGLVDEAGFTRYPEQWTEVVYEANDAQPIPGNQPRWKLVKINPWDYPFPPVIDWQNLPNNNGYYGRPDIAEAIPLNDALNFLASNTQRIIKNHAHPRTVMTGAVAEDIIPTSISGLFALSSPEAKVFNLEMQSDGALVQWFNSLITGGLWQSAGMVDNSTVKDLVGQLTNFGLRVLFANAIKRTEKKRVLYGEAFDAICRYGLELAGRAIPERVVTVWPDVLPEDEATVNTYLEELNRKVISLKTYRSLRGYDDTTESDRLAEEAAQNPNVGAGILGLLANNGAFNRGV